MNTEQEFAAHLRKLREEAESGLREYRRKAGPMLADLAEAGFPVDQISTLYNTRPKINYRYAVPILLRWLPRTGDLNIREEIVRALAVPWHKRSILPVLVAEFERECPQGERTSRYDIYRWTVGDSLSYIADDRVVEDIIRLATDKSYGRSREMLAAALGRMKDQRAVDALIELLDDSEMAGHAVVGLGKTHAVRARPHLERFVSHKVTWVRKEAIRAIAKIDKANPNRKHDCVSPFA